MYIETTTAKTKNGKEYKSVLLRESYRDENGKPKKRTLANLTHQPVEQIIAIQNVLKNAETVSLDNLIQGKGFGDSFVLNYLMDKINIKKSIGTSKIAKLAMLLIAARVSIQGSRLAAYNWQNQNHIANILKINQPIKQIELYEALDYIADNQEEIEDKLFKYNYKDKITNLYLYDVTSSFVEGGYSESELMEYGYNRDKKSGKKQVVIGLLTDKDGKMVSIEVFKGNTNDVKTFINQLDKLKQRFKLQTVTIVGDGGMIKTVDIEKIREYGYEYITSIGKPQIEKLLSKGTIQMSFFDDDLQEIELDKVRYVMRRNPIRAKEIGEKREERIERCKKYIEQLISSYTEHKKSNREVFLRRVTTKITNLNLKSILEFKITFKAITEENKREEIDECSIEINKSALEEEKKLDGCYVMKTSLNGKELTKEEVHKSYKALQKVERAFRKIKTTLLEVRPLYLHGDKRIKGHVFITGLAYNLSRELEDYCNKIGKEYYVVMEELKKVVTVKAVIANKEVEYVPRPNEIVKDLIAAMEISLPTKIV